MSPGIVDRTERAVRPNRACACCQIGGHVDKNDRSL